MKVLVTGADGLLGGSLVKCLIDGGFTVRVMLETGSESPALEGLPLERVEGHVLDPESTHGAVQGVQAVFNCAPVMTLDPPVADWIFALNFEGTRNVLVAMSRAGVENLVHAGSATSFGYGTIEQPGIEENPYNCDHFGLSAFDSMHRAQELILRYNQSGKVRAVLVNPTLVLGPGAILPDASRSTLELACRHNSKYPSGGVNVIGADEAARAALKALGRGRSGRCYILGGENMSYRDLLTKIAGALEITTPERPAPDSAVMLKGLIGSAGRRLGRRKRGFTLGLARLVTTGLYYSSERAARELGLSARPADTVIEETCRWFKDSGLFPGST